MVIVPQDLATDATPFPPEERAIFAYALGRGRPAYHGDPLAIEGRYEDGLARIDAALQHWIDRCHAT